MLTASTYFSQVQAQTYTTESKSCGSCGKAVSNNSRIGMTCPHCGVTWGRENETKTTSYKTAPSYNASTYKPSKIKSYPSRNDNFDDFTSKVGTTNNNANLRAAPSTKSNIITTIPSYTSFDIIRKSGGWYYIEYLFMDWNNLTSRKIRGYLHQSVVR